MTGSGCVYPPYPPRTDLSAGVGTGKGGSFAGDLCSVPTVPTHKERIHRIQIRGQHPSLGMLWANSAFSKVCRKAGTGGYSYPAEPTRRFQESLSVVR